MPARALLTAGRHDAAATLLQAEVDSAVAAGGSSTERAGVLRLWLARTHIATGDQERARQLLELCVAESPAFVDGNLALAEWRVQHAAAAGAAEQLAALLKTGVPAARRAEVLGLLGTAYLEAKQPADAERVFRERLALTPEDPDGPYLLGKALAALGQEAAARAQYEAALSLSPGQVDALAALVRSLESSDPSQAAARLEAQLKRAPRKAALRVVAARFYRDAGDAHAAERAYRAALGLDSKNVGIWMETGYLLVRNGRGASALPLFRNAVKLAPENAEALGMAAQLIDQHGAPEEAAELYERLLERRPKMHAARNNLALLYAEQLGKPERAEQLAREAHASDPANASYADTLGWVLVEGGDAPAGLVLLRQAVEGKPKSAPIHYHLGVARLRTGDVVGGRAALQRALALDKKLPEASAIKKLLAQK